MRAERLEASLSLRSAMTWTVASRRRTSSTTCSSQTSDAVSSPSERSTITAPPQPASAHCGARPRSVA